MMGERPVPFVSALPADALRK